MDLYLFFLVSSDYIVFTEFIIKYLEKTLNEHIEVENHYQETEDYIGCSLFNMFIESEYTSDECDSEFTLDDYQISTNVSVYINIYTAKIIEAIPILKEMVKRLHDSFGTNIIVLNDSSSAVYICSGDKYYINELFWDPTS